MSFLMLFLIPLFLFAGRSYDPFSSDAGVQINDPSAYTIQFKTEEAAEWTALFNRTSGWIGGDGIFSIALTGKETVSDTDSIFFIFSDTMIGDIEGGKLQAGWSMVNNTVACLQGKNPDEDMLKFEYNTSDARKPEAFFVPDTPAAREGDYYWLGDGFLNTALNNSIYIFAYRMRNISDREWGFSEMGNVLIKLPQGSKPPYDDHVQIETPFYLADDNPSGKGSFGAGIFENTSDAGVPSPDGYIYVYGIRGQEKQLLVARVLPHQFESFNTWRFWDGEEWNSDMQASAPLVQNVSNELSVSALPDGRYALVYQENGMGNYVAMRIGTTPYGPFGPQTRVWECSESRQKNYLTYNAKAHPALSQKGELIISYNVNAFDFLNEIQKAPNLYRPRFIKVTFE